MMELSLRDCQKFATLMCDCAGSVATSLFFNGVVQRATTSCTALIVERIAEPIVVESGFAPSFFSCLSWRFFSLRSAFAFSLCSEHFFGGRSIQ